MTCLGTDVMTLLLRRATVADKQRTNPDSQYDGREPQTKERFSSVQSLDRFGGRGGGRGLEGRFSRDPLPVFSADGPCEQFWRGQGCPLFDVVHPAFTLPTTASPTLQGALKDGFGQAVVACDMLTILIRL